MKIPQLSNFKKSLMKYRKDSVLFVDKIDKTLKEIERIENFGEIRCPECLSRDLRFMKKDRIFCRACGYTSPKPLTLSEIGKRDEKKATSPNMDSLHYVKLKL